MKLHDAPDGDVACGVRTTSGLQPATSNRTCKSFKFTVHTVGRRFSKSKSAENACLRRRGLGGIQTLFENISLRFVYDKSFLLFYSTVLYFTAVVRAAGSVGVLEAMSLTSRRLMTVWHRGLSPWPWPWTM